MREPAGARRRRAIGSAGLALAFGVALASVVLAREPAAKRAPDPCTCFPKAALPVALDAMEVGGTWYLSFLTPPCPPVVEVLVGIDGGKPRSLGRAGKTGPNQGAISQMVLEAVEDKTSPSDADRKLQVQLVRRDGSVDGPYSLRFSPREQRLAAAKLALERSPRTFVSFAEHGSAYTWLGFHTLFDLRSSLRAVHYSLDDCSLRWSIVFAADPNAEPIADRGEHETDLTLERPYLTLPKAATRSACVQAVFADGTSSAVLELVRDPRHRIVAED